jgi:hypothetical protein
MSRAKSGQTIARCGKTGFEAVCKCSKRGPEEKGYLRSLTAPEELTAFLSIRGMCLREQGRLSEAVESFAAAAKLAPGCRSYRAVLGSLETALGRQTKREELTLQTAGQSARN